MSIIDSKIKSDLVGLLKQMDEKLETLGKFRIKNFPGNWADSIFASREALGQCLRA